MNLFMICNQVDTAAFSQPPLGYRIRNLRADELDWWKAIHFEGSPDAE